jgi:O-antigen/teichoic acid export membrane protein
MRTTTYATVHVGESSALRNERPHNHDYVGHFNAGPVGDTSTLRGRALCRARLDHRLATDDVRLREPPQLVAADTAADALARPAPTPYRVTVTKRRGQKRLRHRKRNHMVRNSMFSLLSAALQALLGFAFWVLAARVFTPPEVGRATSLISATSVIGFIALFGLNSTLVRFLPTSKHRDALITVTLVLVAAAGMVVAIGYVVALPVIAPQLRFVEHHILFAVGFVLLAGAAGINLLTDSIFIASRRTGINAFVDGGVGGVTKLVLIGLLAGSGTYGLFCASVGGFAAAALVSVILICTQLHYRPQVKGALAALRPLLRFSSANYVANVFSLIPSLVVTLIVLDRLGAFAAGYYYVAFQFANVLYAGAYAVEQNFLAEGAHGEERISSLMWRAGRVLAFLAVPAAIAGALLSHWILVIFGDQYARHATEALLLMALATIPIATQNWLVTVLRLSNQLTAISICNVVYAGSICGLAWFLAPRGLTMIGAAWLLGSLAGVVVATGAVVWGAHRGALQGTVNVAVGGVAETPALAVDGPAPRHGAWAADAGAGGTLAAVPLTEAWVTSLQATETMTVTPVVEVTTAHPTDTDQGVAEDVATEDPDEPSVTKGRRWWPFIAVAAALLVGASLATPAGRHQWDVSIFRQPTHYTTLSFEDAAHLPSTVVAGRSVQLVFAVGNNEGKRLAYAYVVTSANAAGGDVKVVEHATVTVPSGRVQAVAVRAAPVCASSSCRLTIRLPKQSESINALIRVQSPAK